MRQQWFKRQGGGGGASPGLWAELRQVFRSTSLYVSSPDHRIPLAKRRARGTWALIALFAGIHFTLTVVLGRSPDYIAETFGMIPYRLFQGEEPWRLLTAMLVHGSILHLVSNGLFFLVMAPLLERDRGIWVMLGIFLLGGVTGFLLHAAVFHNDMTPTIGASGGIAAVLGVYPLWYRRSMLMLRVEPTVGMIPAVPLVWFWLVMQVVWSVLNPGGGVSYLSHIGGFAAGFLVSLTYNRIKRRRNRRPSLRVVH